MRSLYDVVTTLISGCLDGGSAAWAQLSPTHQLKLLPVRDPKAVERLAARAVKRELSTRQLQELVTDERQRRPKGPGGRPPKNPITQALVRAMSDFAPAGGSGSFKNADLRALSSVEAKAALKAATALERKVQNLRQRLEARLLSR